MSNNAQQQAHDLLRFFLCLFVFFVAILFRDLKSDKETCADHHGEESSLLL